MTFEFYKVVILLMLGISFSACTSNIQPNEQQAKSTSETISTKLENEAIAYGRIRWIENGKDRENYKSSLGWNIQPRFLRMDDMQTGALNVGADGIFTWRFSSGTYLIHQIHWFDAWDGHHRLTPKVAFNIPPDGRAYCLGTLVIDLQSKRDIIGGLWVQGWTIRIEDECDSLHQQFSATMPESSMEYSKSLMIHNQDIPDRPEQLENKDKALEFIRAIIPGLMTIY
jgi:hypothetical protein